MQDGRNKGEDHSQSTGGITRRGFIAGMGAGAVGVAVSNTASGALQKKEESVLPADTLSEITLSINGRNYGLLVEPRWTLLFVLREKLGLTATKIGCGEGECGACTVLIDDIPRYACMTLAVEAEGTRIVTPEGLMAGEELGNVQKAFLEEDALQCGYCIPGQMMSVEGLLRKTPNPTTTQIQRGVSGNICRCGAYKHIFNAAEHAAKTRPGK